MKKLKLTAPYQGWPAGMVGTFREQVALQLLKDKKAEIVVDEPKEEKEVAISKK